MSQTRIWFRATKQVAEAVFAEAERRLEDDGCPLSVYDLDDGSDVFEVSLYLEDADDEAGTRFTDLVAEMAPDAVIGREALGDVDWVAKSLEGLKSVRAGGFLVHGGHDRPAMRTGTISIEIEAGQAFGTGHHGTTAGCLAMIDRIAKRHRPRRVLDLGTGSGVLAIAAAKRLRRARILATDIDPVATRVASENGRLNGVSGAIRFVTAAGFHDASFSAHGPFDLVIANILAGPLMQMSAELFRHTARGGDVILSGILDTQRDRVVACYGAKGFHHRLTTHSRGWSTIWLAR
jgi:ribosomal protein L11 methyltransferase